jgi:hypothetical protein
VKINWTIALLIIVAAALVVVLTGCEKQAPDSRAVATQTVR